MILNQYIDILPYRYILQIPSLCVCCSVHMTRVCVRVCVVCVCVCVRACVCV